MRARGFALTFACVTGFASCCGPSRVEVPARAVALPTARVESRAPAAAALLVCAEPGAKPTPLRVAEVAATVAITGGLATTTLDITFENDLDRVLEGELVLTLPDGGAVSSFALDVGG